MARLSGDCLSCGHCSGCNYPAAAGGHHCGGFHWHFFGVCRPCCLGLVITVALLCTSPVSALLAAGAWSSWWLYSALLQCLPSLLLGPGHHGGSTLHFSGVCPLWSWLSGLWQSSTRVLLDFWAVQGVGDGTQVSARWS